MSQGELVTYQISQLFPSLHGVLEVSNGCKDKELRGNENDDRWDCFTSHNLCSKGVGPRPLIARDRTV